MLLASTNVRKVINMNAWNHSLMTSLEESKQTSEIEVVDEEKCSINREP